MTKAQALKNFMKFCKAAPKEMAHNGWKTNAWDVYVDGLYCANKITERQCDRWHNPFN